MKNFVPTGLFGLLIAALLAAFMSTYAATVNAAPAYIVNDIYKRYINPNWLGADLRVDELRRLDRRGDRRHRRSDCLARGSTAS